MPGTAVEQVQAQDLQARQVLNRTLATADVMAASSLVRAELRNKPEDVRAIAITLYQYGLPVAIQTINACYVVKGSVEFMTKIWTALAQRAGYAVWPDDASSAEVGIAHIADRRTGETHRVTFTWEDATKAGLTGSDTYKKYGRDMLIWRAMARAVRWHAPEVHAGIAPVEELTVERPRPRPIPAEPQAIEQGENPGLTPADIGGPPAAQEPERGPDNAAATIVEQQTAPAPSGPVPGEWRARAVELGKGDALVLKKARDFATARGLDPLPRTIDQITDAGVIADLEEWLR